MTIIIDREYSRSILFSEPYDYYYRPRVLSVYFVFGADDYYYYYYYYYYYSCEVDYKTIQKKLKQLSSLNFHTTWVISR